METLDAVLVYWNLMEVWVVLAGMHLDKPSDLTNQHNLFAPHHQDSRSCYDL
jgi:hypothetical protein